MSEKEDFNSNNIAGTECPVCKSVHTVHGQYVHVMCEDQPDYLVCENCDTSFDKDYGIIEELK